MKNYLRRAHKAELRINNKLEQLESLRSLAEKTTTTLQHTPKCKIGGTKIEGIVAKIVDLEEEIKNDIEELLYIKSEVRDAIKTVGVPELELLLELRYLCYKSWSYIAHEMNYDERYIHKLHGKALSAIKLDTKRHKKTPKDTNFSAIM